jgi:hypothetical protein
MGRVSREEFSRAPARQRGAAAVAVLSALLLALTTFARVLPSEAAPKPKVTGQSRESGPASHFDTSPPLTAMPIAPQSAEDKQKKEHHDKRDAHVQQHPATDAPDPVVQSAPVGAAAPAATNSFDGLGEGFTGPQGAFSVDTAPPDTTFAVGPSHIVEMVNSSFAILNKGGAVLYGPATNNTLFGGFGGFCESTNDGDPIVRYDSMADRWILSQFANVRSSSGPYLECVAVSKTGDPTGAYNRYSFQFSKFADYPKLAVWPDGYYVTYNLFSGNTFSGTETCAMDRSKMMQGLAASQQCFTTSTSYLGLLASDVDGSRPPPAGEPNLVVALGTTSTSLATWRFHVDWANPANTTFTGPSAMTVASYSTACSGGACIPQPGTTDVLDSLADRLMFRLAYRNLGDHESFVVTHAVTAGSGAGARWYELRPLGGGVAVYQQGTYAPDANSRWMSSAAMDRSGDIGLGFSASGASLHPSVRYTGRLAGDPAGQMTQGEGSLVDGGGSQLFEPRNRWGDYSNMDVDPANGCTFWYSNEYLAVDGTFNWHTRIGSFSLPGCGTTQANDFSLSATPWAVALTAGASATSTVSTAVTSGSAQAVSLSASGLPSGTTATFSPSSVTAGGPSTMTVATAAGTPAGTYNVTVTGTGASATHSTTFTLTVQSPATYLSVNDVTVTEGNSGTTPATFTVTRSGNTTGTSSVNYATANSTATAPGDYTALTSTTVSFAAGETTKSVSVAIVGDTVDEPNETLSLKLSSPVGATISDDTGTATILDDDATAYLGVNDATLVEGNTGSGPATFTITRSGSTAVSSSVTYATANGSATAGSDYTAVGPTTVTFAAGETSKSVTVTVTGDNVDEPNETFLLKLSSPVGATLSDDTGTGTIVDDDAPTYLSVNDVTVSEGAGGTTATAGFAITRSGNTAGPSSVTYATANGTATAGADYTTVGPTTVTFAAGETSKTVPVTVTGDNLDEPNETFLLRLSSPVGATLSDDTGTATISDDDAPTYLAVNDVSIGEGNSGTTTATFTVTRSGSTAGTSSVTYATANGTATAGSDYTAVAATTLSFAAGETSKTVPVGVTGDQVDEPDETFTVKLTSPVGATLSDDTGTGTIVDDDAPTYLSVNDASVTEGNSGSTPATFTITRGGNTAAPSTVTYATTNGTATAGSDYSALAAATLSFAAGETSKTVSVSVTGDLVDEPDETFSLKLSSPVGATVSDDTGTGTIVDDDAPTYLSVSDVTLAEGNSGTSPAGFAVTRSGNTAGTSSVTYATANGTATAGSDYTAIAPTVLTFAAGETSKTVAVTVTGDTVPEPDETFLVKLSSPSAATVSDDTGTGTISDDDAPTYLTVGDAVVTEGNSGTTAATFTVTRSGSTAGTSSVTYATANGTAAAGGDYTAIGATRLSFAAGETSKTVAVAVVGDTVDEANETFLVKLSAPTGALISDDTGTGTIVDDDGPITPGPTTFLAVNDAAVAEGNSGTVPATFTITRSGDTTGTSSVTYATATGTATAGTDYTALGSTTVTFAAGETSKTVTVSVTGDTVDEPNETFVLKLSAPAGAVISDDTGTATILDDDAPTMLSVGDLAVTEGNAGTTPATFTVTRSGSTAGSSSVTYATANGTATAGSDYTAVGATTLSFAAGETSKTVTVPVTGDTVDEPNETFALKLSAPVAATISDDTGTATIVDDDAPTTFSVNDVSLPEGDTGTAPATFTVTRSGSTAGSSSVTYATANGTATAGSDYTAVAATPLSFVAGETSKTVTVAVTGDTLDEPNETFLVKLSSPVGATISDDTGTATIVDDDASTYLAVSDVAVPEGDSGTTPATFTVTRSGSTTGATSVTYATSNGTATAGSDYTAVAPTVVTFAAGETSKAVTVLVTGDTLVEPDETFTLKLSPAAGMILSDDTATATILNDDAPTYLAVDDLSVSEGNGGTTPATFTVTRSGSTAGTSSVTYATANGTATAGSDYTAVAPTVLTFAAGETSKTVTVGVTGDTAVEPNETVLVKLSSPVGAVVSDDTGTATIVDDDGTTTTGPTTFVAVNDLSVTEGNSGTTPVTFTVTRTGNTAGASSVTYATANGTALAGSDYTAVAPTVLTFAAGETAKTVTVPVTGDLVDEPDETFLLKLSSPTGATVSDDTGTATIVDDDAPAYVSLNDISVTEGNSGTTAATFTVTRSGNTAVPSSVTYATANGTATAGSDYTALAPTVLSFAAGETSKAVTVSVSGDTLAEPDETFVLKLSAPVGATISDDTGTAIVKNDDGSL